MAEFKQPAGSGRAKSRKSESDFFGTSCTMYNVQIVHEYRKKNKLKLPRREIAISPMRASWRSTTNTLLPTAGEKLASLLN